MRFRFDRDAAREVLGDVSRYAIGLHSWIGILVFPFYVLWFACVVASVPVRLLNCVMVKFGN